MALKTYLKNTAIGLATLAVTLFGAAANAEEANHDSKGSAASPAKSGSGYEKVIKHEPIGQKGNFGIENPMTKEDTSVKINLDYRLGLGTEQISDANGRTKGSVNTNQISLDGFVNSWWEDLYVRASFSYLNINRFEQETLTPKLRINRRERILNSEKLESHLGVGAGFRLAGDYIRLDATALGSIWDSSFQGGFRVSLNGDYKEIKWDLSYITFGKVQQFRGEIDANVYDVLTAHAFLKNTIGEWEAGFGPGVNLDADDNFNARISPMYTFKKNRFGETHMFGLTMSFNIPGYDYQQTKKVVKYVKKDKEQEAANTAAAQAALDALQDAETTLSHVPTEKLVPIDFEGIDCYASDCRLRESAADKLSYAVSMASARGFHITITSANRSEEKQRELYEDDSRLVCGPDFSECPHVSGYAVDLHIDEFDNSRTCMGHRCDRADARYDPNNEEHAMIRDIFKLAGCSFIDSEWWHVECYPNSSKGELHVKKE